MASYEKIASPLNGVEILLNKVVEDERGYFLDVAETDNPTIQTTKHIHAVIAREKHSVRGEHSHFRLSEDFYILSGTTLCMLYDDNEESPTYQQAYAFVAGTKQEDVAELKLDTYFTEDKHLAQIRIPPKVWHAVWSLDEGGSTILVLGTEGYNETDFKKVKAGDIQPVREILEGMGIDC